VTLIPFSSKCFRWAYTNMACRMCRNQTVRLSRMTFVRNQVQTVASDTNLWENIFHPSHFLENTISQRSTGLTRDIIKRQARVVPLKWRKHCHDLGMVWLTKTGFSDWAMDLLGTQLTTLDYNFQSMALWPIRLSVYSPHAISQIVFLQFTTHAPSPLPSAVLCYQLPMADVPLSGVPNYPRPRATATLSAPPSLPTQVLELCPKLTPTEYVLISSTLVGLVATYYFLSEICGLVSVGRPLWREDGSEICSAITQWSESLRTHKHTLLSHLRFSQPGGPGSLIYIPQKQGGPVILPGDRIPFTSPLTTRRATVEVF
jgi:hypothetical protein